MNTCRFCKKSEFDGRQKGKYRLVKYGVRHYAHADCGLKALGAEFFDRLTPWECTQFPYFAAKAAGLAKELFRRCDEYVA